MVVFLSSHGYVECYVQIWFITAGVILYISDCRYLKLFYQLSYDLSTLSIYFAYFPRLWLTGCHKKQDFLGLLKTFF